jgi:predicted NBD/HSP70 family sugar kinase
MEKKMTTKQFCNDCGTKFDFEPEDRFDRPCCPACGRWDCYEDTAAGGAASRASTQAHDDKLIEIDFEFEPDEVQ